ncbi:sodium:proton exchanger [Pseudonocardia sp. H11422]|uniref:sodium:proton exchanger n=1 Tax=Pseudonocardia sp. H11422 TaxID=2835866 RepID=UPI0027E2663E|nr:sodium:proton exchanger [Pseudonocardia sp. H11422]
MPLQFLLAVLVALPGAYLGAASYLGLPHPEFAPPLAALIYGLAIIGAAFVLAWAAEAAQVDISSGLALAVLALLAVLPEYAVDFVFSFQAGQLYEETGACLPGPEGASPCSLALANMTGANRVLVGIGWPLVVLVATFAVLRTRRAGGHDSASTHAGCVQLPRKMAPEVVFLGLATLYSLTLPLRHTLTLLDAAVLVSIFVAYAWRLAQAPADPPELIGTSAWVGSSDTAPRRWTVGGMFAFAALVILATAEHFAEGLVTTGRELGVNQFILVQWVAPLASESPELIVACLYAWRLKAADSLGTLLSSKVNQWTLLVGTIPIVFALAGSTTDGLPLDEQQRYELLLTAAQSLFAVSLLVTLALTVWGAVALFVLFMVQFVSSLTLPPATDRIIVVVMSVLYGLLAVGLFLRHRRELARLTRDGLVTSFGELEEADERQGG